MKSKKEIKEKIKIFKVEIEIQENQCRYPLPTEEYNNHVDIINEIYRNINLLKWVLNK